VRLPSAYRSEFKSTQNIIDFYLLAHRFPINR